MQKSILNDAVIYFFDSSDPLTYIHWSLIDSKTAEKGDLHQFYSKNTDLHRSTKTWRVTSEYLGRSARHNFNLE